MELDDEPALVPQHSLWGEWLLDECSETRLCLSKRPQAFFGDLGRQALATLIALGFAFALVVSIYADVLDIAWLVWPVVALLGGVAILGMLGVVRAVRQGLGGIRLEIDIPKQALWGVVVSRGFWESYMAKVQRHDLKKAHAVVLYTYHRAGAEHRSNRARCELVVELSDGQRLQGPDVWAPEPNHGDAQERLHPLAETIAHMANIPLELKDEG